MPEITTTTSAVKAIFSLDVVTAIFASLLLVLAVALVITRITKGHIRSFTRRTSAGPLKTTLSTHLCLVPALLCFTIAYAVQSALVALQVNAASPVSITAVFGYSDGNYIDDVSTQTISALTFSQQFASILFTVFLTAAVWLHSNNLTTNGTNVNSPGTLSKIWNAAILTAILAFGLAAWGQGLSVRDGGQNPSTFQDTVDSDRITRILFIVYRCVVIFTSTSVSIEVIRNYINLKGNGTPGNTERPLLARFTFVVVPIIFIRNVFIIVNIVMIYESVSSRANEALAFLFIIFGQFANLIILFMVLWGAWSMGRSAGKGMTDGSS
ncbi:MAG: hypothetical protein Q9169_001125 [Polycauliona sp. 2 TL-2023]